MKDILLNDGNAIPAIGFGVYMIPNDGSAYNSVKGALRVGYRHIDTAAAHFNGAEVGRAVQDSGIPSKEDFDVYMAHPYHMDYVNKTGDMRFKRSSFASAQFVF